MNILDTIIVDENMREEAEVLQSMAYELESAINEFYSILNKTYSVAIMSGSTSSSVEAFAEIVRQFNHKMETLGNAAKLSIDTFIDEIDKADKYLY